MKDGQQRHDPGAGRDLSAFVDEMQAASMPDSTGVKEEELHLVVFSLDEEEYGVPIQEVREILRVPEISRMPQAPAHVRGVINIRGQILPVVEIRTRLGLDPLEITSNSRVLLADANDRVFGLLVDGVSQVLRAPASALRNGEEVAVSSEGYIRGLAQVDSRLIILLDIARVLQLQVA